MAQRAHYTKYRTGDALRLQWELVVDPEIRRILTLDQMLTVFRRTIRPERFTFARTEETLEDAGQLLIGYSGEACCQSCQGVWSRDGHTVSFYLDDAVENNPDRTVSAACLWWEVEEEDAVVEGWFQELAQALDDAEENLVLFGKIN